MDEKTAWAALHRALKFGDAEQIAAHEFLVALRDVSDALPNPFGTDLETDAFMAVAKDMARWT